MDENIVHAICATLEDTECKYGGPLERPWSSYANARLVRLHVWPWAACILTGKDIPGASLAGRGPGTIKIEELRFWLKCRGDSLKGYRLKTKALLVKR